MCDYEVLEVEGWWSGTEFEEGYWERKGEDYGESDVYIAVYIGWGYETGFE